MPPQIDRPVQVPSAGCKIPPYNEVRAQLNEFDYEYDNDNDHDGRNSFFFNDTATTEIYT